ncbi:MAG: hypothetical protein FWE06_09670 [Oscillospiraceae bacterium]|nr:hypothetical protein [Oscillospiraceae bacterium]
MKKWMLSGAAIAVAAVIVVVFAVSRIADRQLYNHSLHEPGHAKNLFNGITLLTSPAVSWSFMWQPDSSRPSMDFAFARWSYTRADSINSVQSTGTIDFRQNGGVTLNEYDDYLQLGMLTAPQSLFLDGSLDVWGMLDDDQAYIAWVRFDEPVDGVAFAEQFYYFFGWDAPDDIDDFTARRLHMVWPAIKTSHDSTDVCLGTEGSVFNWWHGTAPRMHARHQELFLSPYAETMYWRTGLWEREVIFTETLRFLAENQADADLLTGLGIWENAEVIDWAERLAFVEAYGFQYLGFVANMPGHELRVLLEKGLHVVRIDFDV